jgi:hypothetical protein
LAEKAGWLQTLRQTAPEALGLARKLDPTYEVPGVTSIDAAFLEERGIRGLIWDVDGTLTPYHAPRPPQEISLHLERLRAIPWLRQVILSNCGDERFRELGRIFPAMEVLKVYRQGSHRVHRALLGDAEWWQGGEDGRQGLTAIRKPSADLVAFAVERLGVEASQAAMVGDQYWTDVAGANLAGVRSVKVQTLAPESFPASIRFFQGVESVVRRVLRS